MRYSKLRYIGRVKNFWDFSRERERERERESTSIIAKTTYIQTGAFDSIYDIGILLYA